MIVSQPEPALAERSRASRRGRILLLYALLVAGTAAVFLLALDRGRHLPAGAPARAVQPALGAHGAAVLPRVLLALAVIIVFARLVGLVFRRLGQPAVIGEVVAGILLGPSLLGRVAPDVLRFVMPPEAAPHLSLLAQLGVIVYMFLVGLELDTARLRHRTHATVLISHASILAPFALGSALALVLYPRLATSDVGFGVFALFLGVSMSVTAFPVLARILTDRGLQRTTLGARALTCAAVDDVTAWCLLAVLVSVAQSRLLGAVHTIGWALVYVAVMLAVVRPIVRRLIGGRVGGLTQGAMAAICAAMLSSALVTELIGIHALFGAFLLGVLMPSDTRIAAELKTRFEDVVLVLFLPAFFAFTGLRTEIGLVSGAEDWLLTVLIVIVASLGKFGGTLAAGWYSGLGLRESCSLGILMNTRGLMELVVLNVGYDLGIISPRLFAMLVLMALATTLATSPLLAWLSRRQQAAGREEVGDAAWREAFAAHR
jgi:Kef-type K+ transport system membrane component KefB